MGEKERICASDKNELPLAGRSSRRLDRESWFLIQRKFVFYRDKKSGEIICLSALRYQSSQFSVNSIPSWDFRHFSRILDPF